MSVPVSFVVFRFTEKSVALTMADSISVKRLRSSDVWAEIIRDFRPVAAPSGDEPPRLHDPGSITV